LLPNPLRTVINRLKLNKANLMGSLLYTLRELDKWYNVYTIVVICS